MKLKSTGLGATELIGDLTEMERSMSGVLMRVKIKKPVIWRVRVFLSPKDLRAIVYQALLPKTVWFVVKTLLGKGKPKKILSNAGSAKEKPVKNET